MWVWISRLAISANCITTTVKCPFNLYPLLHDKNSQDHKDLGRTYLWSEEACPGPPQTYLWSEEDCPGPPPGSSSPGSHPGADWRESPPPHSQPAAEETIIKNVEHKICFMVSIDWLWSCLGYHETAGSDSKHNTFAGKIVENLTEKLHMCGWVNLPRDVWSCQKKSRLSWYQSSQNPKEPEAGQSSRTAWQGPFGEMPERLLWSPSSSSSSALPPLLAPHSLKIKMKIDLDWLTISQFRSNSNFT